MGPPSELLELRFARGRIGCIVPVLAVAALAFGWWAVDPEGLADGRGSWLVDIGRPLTVAGVNLPVLAVSGFLLWELWRLGMRWADGVAVRADRAGLTFHNTLLRRRHVPWEEVQDVRYRLALIGAAAVPEVLFVVGGHTVRARGIDNGGGAAEHFVEAVRARMKSGA